MGVEATAIAYSDDDLKKLLAENVKEDAPQNLEAKADDIKLLSVDAAITSRGLNLTGNFEAKFVPKFEENDLKEKIAGKSVKKTREIIKSLPEVSDVSVNFSPSFFFASTLPINKEKITFKVKKQRSILFCSDFDYWLRSSFIRNLAFFRLANEYSSKAFWRVR